LQAVVVSVRHENFIFGIDGNGVGQPELAGAGTAFAKIEKQPA
jgi:hypothetical protein